MNKFASNMYKMLKEETLCIFQDRYIPCSIYQELNEWENKTYIKSLSYGTESEIQKYFNYPIVSGYMNLSTENKIWNIPTLIDHLYIKGAIPEHQWIARTRGQEILGTSNFLDTDNLIVTKDVLYKLHCGSNADILSELHSHNIMLFITNKTEMYVEKEICQIGINWLNKNFGCRRNIKKYKFKYEPLKLSNKSLNLTSLDNE